jgi:hypothetical protein
MIALIVEKALEGIEMILLKQAYPHCYRQWMVYQMILWRKISYYSFFTTKVSYK